jgi:hypothetical protein
VLLCTLTNTNTQAALLRAKLTPLNIDLSSGRFAMFNKKRDTAGIGKLFGTVV